MQQRFETFTVLIAKISRSIRRIKAEEMSEFYLKGPHVSCLYYLTQLGPLTAGQLCDRCEADKAAVSRSLEYLEQNGYVTRPDKRYRSPLTLTEKGQETGRAIAGKIDRLVEDDQYFYIFQSRQMAVMIPKGSLLPANPERFAKVLAKETGKDWQRSKSLWGLNLKDLVQMGKDRFQRSAS